jgi:hypothetical protein
MNRRPVWVVPFAAAFALVLLMAACSKSAERSAGPTALTVVTMTRPATYTPSPPTATYTRAPSPTLAPPTATLTPALTPTLTPVLTLLDRLPTQKNQDFTLTLTNADLSQRNLVLKSGVPRFALNNMKTSILCYFCFEVVNGEPRLRITPGLTTPGDAPRDLLSPTDLAQIGGGANWSAMAEGMVNNALWYVNPDRPQNAGLSGFVITEVMQQEGLLVLAGRTQ